MSERYSKQDMDAFLHIPIDIYIRDMYFIQCDRDVMKVRHDEKFTGGIPDMPPEIKGAVFESKEDEISVIILWVEDLQDLAHEIFHCVDLVLGQAGLFLTPESVEAYTYLTGYIDSKCRKGYNGGIAERI